MKKLLKKMEWISYRNKINYNEIVIDLICIAGICIVILIVIKL